MRRYALVIEVSAREIADEETARLHEEATPELREDARAGIGAEVMQYFRDRMPDAAKINVSVRFEEVAE